MLIALVIITKIQITLIVFIIAFITNFQIFRLLLARIIDFALVKAPLSSLALKPRLIRVSLNKLYILENNIRKREYNNSASNL